MHESDLARLRKWLDLPAGVPPEAWPPNHYTLLGLPIGERDPATIETHTLDRMDRLRAYQLPYPDPVTEGMNRLAQAMMTLSDPISRSAYDRELGIAPRVPEPEPIPFAVELPPPTPVAAPNASPKVSKKKATKQARPPIREEDQQTATRRRAVRRLVGVRRILTRWRPLEDAFIERSAAQSRFTESRRLAETFAELRDAIAASDEPFASPGQPGSLVAAIARQSLPVPMVQSLLPSQRDNLAVDWRKGQRWLNDRMSALRSEIDSLRVEPPLRGVMRTIDEVRRSHGWVLLSLGTLAMLIALLRSIPRL